MQEFDPAELKKLYIPPVDSHKGQNGKLLLIGGSHLFHVASLWALSIASKIVDMVYYASVPENNELVRQAKAEFRNGIVIPRSRIDDYINEADCILIGPGLPRPEGVMSGDDDTKALTETLLKKYPNKKWVIDGGSLQVIEPEILPKNCIVTPHQKEFNTLFDSKFKIKDLRIKADDVSEMAKMYECTIVLKGEKDIIS